MIKAIVEKMLVGDDMRTMWATIGSSGLGLLSKRRKEMRTVLKFRDGFHDP